MRGLRRFFPAVVLLLFAWPRLASAQNGTVGEASAIRLEPVAWDLTQIGATFEYVVGHGEGYSFDKVVVTNSSQRLTIPTFENMLSVGYGHWFIVTHGEQGTILIEAFTGTAQGQAQRDQVLAGYYGSGYMTSELVPTDVLGDLPGTFAVHGISVTTAFLSLRFVSTSSVVDVRACDCWSLRGGFPSARAFIGYDYIVTNVIVLAEVNTTYGNLAGWNGLANRAIYNAIGGTSVRTQGNLNTVLSPAVVSITPALPSTLTARGMYTITFDCAMDTQTIADNIVDGTGALYTYGAYWQDAYHLVFSLTGLFKGSTGGICINSDSTSTFSGAASAWPAGISLDGNTNGGLSGTSGHSPNGDDYVVGGIMSNIADNPAALVSGFVVMRDPSGPLAQWFVTSEVNTAYYLVESAPDPVGPYTPVAKVMATGARKYQALMPGGSDFAFRLREVETDGDTLTHLFTTLEDQIVPVLPPASNTAAATEQLKQLPVRYTITPTDALATQRMQSAVTDVIYAPQAFAAQGQVLANFKNSIGIPTIVVILENIGGSAGIKPNIATQVMAGVRNFLLLGSANDDHDVQGFQVWNNPAVWDSGYVQTAWSQPQPQNNIIPMGQYTVIPGQQGVSMPWWQKVIASDWWYIDLDGDGLPDQGLAIGRGPATNGTEATNFVSKQIAAFQINPNAPGVNHVSVFTYAFDAGGNSGAEVKAFTDTLVQYLPSTVTVSRYTDEPTHWYSNSGRDALCTSWYNSGYALQIYKSTVNSRYHDAGCLDKTRYASLNLASNPTRPAFVYVSDCGGGDADRTWEDEFGQPLNAQLLVHWPDRGCSGYFGLSRGSWQYGNLLMDKEFLPRLYGYGAPSTGHAAVISVRNLAISHPEFRDLALSYVFFGDPSVKLPFMRVNVGVENQMLQSRVELAGPRPNPMHGSSLIGFTLPQAALVELNVYDLQGRLVEQLASGERQAGSSTVRFDSRRIQGGVYFVRLRTGQFERVQKLIVLR